MSRSNSWNWHILTGLLLIFLLGGHMIAMHLDLILGWFNPGNPANEKLEGVDWANVAARGRQLSTAVFYIVFLGVALFHGLYGLRTIIFELGVGKEREKTITTVMVTIGIFLFIIGVYAAIAFKSVAGGA